MLLHLTGVRACARDDGDAAVDVIDHAFQCFDILLQRGGRRLARGAERKDRVRTVGDVPVTQLPKAGKINAAVLMERSDQRDDGPVSFSFCVSSCLRQNLQPCTHKNSISGQKCKLFSRRMHPARENPQAGPLWNVFALRDLWKRENIHDFFRFILQLIYYCDMLETS